MGEPIPCPSCRKPLRVPADFHLAWLTCPRCLAVIPNPAAPAPGPEAATHPVAEREPSASAAGDRGPNPGAYASPDAPAPAQPVPPRCPGCGRPTERQWLFCPYCEEPLRAPVGGVEARVGRDTRRTGVGIILLSVLGGCGLLFTLMATGGALAEGEPFPLVVFLLAVLVLAGVSTLITLRRNRGDRRAVGPGRILVGTLALAGVIVALLALVWVALLVFLFAVCLAGAGRL